MSDLHAGSHADDVARLTAIVKEAAAFKPDLVLHGGDFVNMQLFGGGRLSPYAVARILAPLDAPLGRFAVLGNHDYNYGAGEISAALMNEGIIVLHDEKRDLAFEGRRIELIGLPDTRRLRDSGRALLAGLLSETPTIILTHDPYWFAHVPKGPYLTLAGHTHGGQIRLPVIGALRNASRAPLRWTYGFVREDQRVLYVTSGIGTSGIPFESAFLPEYAIQYLKGILNFLQDHQAAFSADQGLLPQARGVEASAADAGAVQPEYGRATHAVPLHDDRDRGKARGVGWRMSLRIWRASDQLECAYLHLAGIVAALPPHAAAILRRSSRRSERMPKARRCPRVAQTGRTLTS